MLSEPNFAARKIVMIHANQGEKITFSNDNLIIKPELFISFLYKCGAPHSITIIAI